MSDLQVFAKGAHLSARTSGRLATTWRRARQTWRWTLSSLAVSASDPSPDLFGTASTAARRDYRQGRARLDPSVAMLHDAIVHFTRALDADPGFALALLGRADAYTQMRLFVEAQVDYTRVLTLPTCSSDLRLQARIGRARAYDGQGAHDLAIQDVTDAIGVAGADRSALLVCRSELYLGCHRLQAALDDARAAVDVGPVTGRALAQLARAYSALGAHDRAYRECTRACDMSPATGAPDAFIARAAVLLADDRPTAAVLDATEAVQRAPSCPDAYLQRAAVYKALELWDEAIADLTTAARLAPYDGAVLDDRAACLEAIGEHERAIQDRAQALRIAGDCDLAVKAFEREAMVNAKSRVDRWSRTRRAPADAKWNTDGDDDDDSTGQEVVDGADGNGHQ
ncbi:Tetratricopeptide repeat [Plasmodiophora brassicae]